MVNADVVGSEVYLLLSQTCFCKAPFSSYVSIELASAWFLLIIDKIVSFKLKKKSQTHRNRVGWWLPEAGRWERKEEAGKWLQTSNYKMNTS